MRRTRAMSASPRPSPPRSDELDVRGDAEQPPLEESTFNEAEGTAPMSAPLPPTLKVCSGESGSFECIVIVAEAGEPEIAWKVTGSA